ncbi:MAG TPA: glycine C-acetyltransferase [Sphingomonas sp.]|nr:glycine C-acetyltransferase [Sphingomonas sp.]
MPSSFYERISTELAAIHADGLFKPERIIQSRQGPAVQVGGREVLNFCANNYLGLGGDRRIVDAAEAATERWGAGLASVRFICGTQEIHKELESAIASYLGREDAILFAAAFDANGGVFEPLLGEQDCIISDSLNHASIIDGVRLCKAARKRFANSDMDELETRLKEARAEGARTILIATDGVFSMDGHIARLDAITTLAERYDALVMVDDAHATGIIGPEGRGSGAYRGVEDRIDILTGTFGKALGGAMGGYIAGKKPVIDLLRQRARPYLFSNSLAPAICGASLKAIEIARGPDGEALRARLARNAERFRAGMAKAGFDLIEGEHPIIPVMLYDARLAQQLAARLLELGVYVTGFSFPVVPKGQARIRTQMSAAHEDEHIDRALAAFAKAGRELGAVK